MHESWSTRAVPVSFIKKLFGFEYSKNKIINDPFEITTAHGTSNENYRTKFSILKSKIKLKFFLFNFHDQFDLLLELDNIKLLSIQLD